MKRHLIIVSVLGLLASLVACDGQFAFFGSPTQTQVQGAVPSPTPTPTPTVFATPDPCRIESVKETGQPPERSEEHTSELQSQFHLVCRLLLEKKKKKHNTHSTTGN